MFYQLPVAPSPNLQNMNAVYLYPSLCLFEGTVISVGRGTNYPFQCYGHPDLKTDTFRFTPHSIKGVSDHPLYENKRCFGTKIELKNKIDSVNIKKLDLTYLLKAYTHFENKDRFFNSFFEKLIGDSCVKPQIINKLNEIDIRNNWQKELNDFKIIRSKYLLYPDFI